MDEHPLLDIAIDVQPGGGAQVRLRFEDPEAVVAADDVPGALVLPDPVKWPDPKTQPESFGKKLTDALLATPTVRAEFVRALNATLGAAHPRPLRICLRLPATGGAAADTLRNLTWETLLDPRDKQEQPLLSHSTVYFARHLPGQKTVGAALARRPRALVVIANPPKLAKGTINIGPLKLWPVDVKGERDRARQGLRKLIAQELYDLDGQPGKVSLENLLAELKREKPYQILYLVCHGAVLKEKKPAGPYLWLDEVDEEPVHAQRLVDALADMEAERRPRLVVLASCQSAGGTSDDNSSSDKDMLAASGPKPVQDDGILALGPKLLQEGGILAVVAMQGDVFMRTVEAFMPVFFGELAKNGQVERAMAVARSSVRTVPSEEAVRKQWPVPVLFSRLKTGQIWPAGAPWDIQPKAFEPETVLIPAGEFSMGSDPGPGIPKHETPQHLVTLPAYSIGKYPITNALYAVFLQQQPAHPALPPGAKWLGRKPPKGREQHPVVWVSWSDAQAYCRWLSQHTESTYRLPTEAEWEKAARGPLDLTYPWGNEWADGRCNVENKGTTPVTDHEKGASPYDCHDMVGNIEEWTSTIWGAREDSPAFEYPYDATDGREDPARGGEYEPHLYRVYRSCAFEAARSAARCTERGGSDQTTCVYWRGFRVVMEVDGT